MSQWFLRAAARVCVRARLFACETNTNVRCEVGELAVSNALHWLVAE